MTDPVTQSEADPAGSDPSTRLVTQVDPSRTLGAIHPPPTPVRSARTTGRHRGLPRPRRRRAARSGSSPRPGFPVDRISIVGTGIESETRDQRGFVTVGRPRRIPARQRAPGWEACSASSAGRRALQFPALASCCSGPAGGGRGRGRGRHSCSGAPSAPSSDTSWPRSISRSTRGRPHRQLPARRYGTEEEVAAGAAAPHRARVTPTSSAMTSTAGVHRPDRADRAGLEGMRVVDVDGEEVGKVEFVKLGDPQADHVVRARTRSTIPSCRARR